MKNQNSIFEYLIEQLIDKDYAFIDNFLPDSTLVKLNEQLQNLQQNELMKRAGIGQTVEHEIDKSIRGDEIKWIEKNSGLPFEEKFNRQIDSFCKYLNRTCFLSLNDFEFHYTCYPSGTFYKKHIDQFHNDRSRVLSVILYLNKDWRKEHGGEVRLYLKNGEEVTLPPTWGRVICFRSDELPHEVLTTNRERRSITGWLKSVNSENLIQLID